MIISVCLTGLATRPWVSDLQNALPNATVTAWKPGDLPADHAIVWNPPQQFIDEQPRLQTLFSIGAGVDSLIKLKLLPQTAIVKLDDATMSLQMTEYICHSVIRYFREFESYAVDKNTCKWSYRKINSRSDFAVGVMGLGRLGIQVAKTLQELGYSVNGYSRTIKEVPNVNCYAGLDGLSDFLKNTRILVNLLPLTPSTENILNYQTLVKLQPGGYVINVARGEHLVDEDLLTLLNNEQLSGATLDVFRTEPLPTSHVFWKHPKITITPHIASRLPRETTVAHIANKIKNLELGNSITGVIDTNLGY